MHNRLAITACAGLVMAGLLGAMERQTLGQPAPAAPADTAALRAQYEQWRTEFKTWAPVGQESKGTTSLITPQKVASALALAKQGVVVSLAHTEPQTVAADVGPPGIFHRTMNAVTDVGSAAITR
jgi:hypothetical protein